MKSECLDPTYCSSVPIESLCGPCMEALEDAAIANLANFGTPDYFIHPECGRKYPDAESFINHFPCGDDKC